MLIKNNFFLRHARVLLIIAGVIIIISIILTINSFKDTKTTLAVTERAVSVARKGDVQVSISGSGTIQSASTKDIASEVSANVKNVYVSVGDKVNKGDLLFELDSSDLETQIRNKQRSVNNLSETVKEYKEDIKNLNI